MRILVGVDEGLNNGQKGRTGNGVGRVLPLDDFVLNRGQQTLQGIILLG